MINYYKENIQLYLLFSFWVLIGVFGGPLIYGVLPITLFLMKQKNMYEEMFIGYFFILILSDSLEYQLGFAKNLKNEYISIIALFFFFDKKSFLPYNDLYKAFFPFFLFSFFTMTLSVGEPYFFTSFQKTLSYFLMFLIMPTYITKLFRENGLGFIKRFILFSITILIIGFLLKYIAPNVAYIVAGRFRGFLGNPNGLGTFSVLLFIIFFVITKNIKNMFSYYGLYVFYFIIIFSIYMTGSRNSIIAILIFLIFQFFYKMSPWLGFLICMCAILLAEYLTVNLQSIILSLGLGDFFRVNTLDGGSGRYIAWEFAWKQIQENFFIGKGFAYNEFYMRQYYRLLAKLGHQGGIHNSFLTFWMDQGIIGLLIYLYCFVLIFIQAAKNTVYSFAIMFTIIFSAMFESWLVGSLSPFAFLGIFLLTLINSKEMLLISSKIPDTN